MSGSGEVPEPPRPSRFGPITLTDVVRYQGASGDLTAVHHDDAIARGNGYPGVFVPGLLSAGLLGDWLTGWLGVGTLRRFGVRFREQVWLGDVLECNGAVAQVVVVDGTTRIEVDLSCLRSGTVVTKGWATVVLP